MLLRKDTANTQEHKDKYKALSERDSGFTTNLNGGFELEEHRLAHEDFTSLKAKCFHFMLCQVYLLSRAASTNLEQALYDAVHIQILHPAQQVGASELRIVRAMEAFLHSPFLFLWRDAVRSALNRFSKHR